MTAGGREELLTLPADDFSGGGGGNSGSAAGDGRGPNAGQMSGPPISNSVDVRNRKAPEARDRGRAHDPLVKTEPLQK